MQFVQRKHGNIQQSANAEISPKRFQHPRLTDPSILVTALRHEDVWGRGNQTDIRLKLRLFIPREGPALPTGS